MSEKDAAAVAALRLQVAALKGKMSGIEARRPFDDMMEHVPAVPGVSYMLGMVGGMSGMWCRPDDAPLDVAILYLHGGAYMLGSAKAYRHFVGRIVVRCGVAAFVADYRLAPENTFSAAIDDALAAYRGLMTQGATRLTILGDSAGGGLSLSLLALVQASANRGDELASLAVVAMSASTDLALTGASLEYRANEDPLVTKDMLPTAATEYLAGNDPFDPLASPLYAGLGSQAPVQLHIGTNEVLLEDLRRYAKRFRDAGVEAVVHVWEDMMHVFPSSIGMLAASNAAVIMMPAFLEEKLGVKAR